MYHHITNNDENNYLYDLKKKNDGKVWLSVLFNWM